MARLSGQRKKIIQPKACIGFLWKSRKAKKLKKASRTSGWTKGDTCKASSLERYFVTKSRSYKHPLYNNWAKKVIRWNNTSDPRLTSWDRV